MRTYATTVLLVLFAFGCGGEEPASPDEAGPGKTPEETFAALVTCVTEDRLDEVYGLLAADQQELVRSGIERMRDHVRTERVPPREREMYERRIGMDLTEFAKLTVPAAYAATLPHETGPQASARPIDELRGAVVARVEELGEGRVQVWFSVDGVEQPGTVRLREEDGRWVLGDGKRIVLSALARNAPERLECLDHLQELGALLMTLRQAGGHFRLEGGPAFLLQFRTWVVDDDALDVFLCPGDPLAAQLTARPQLFVKQMRGDDPLCTYRVADDAMIEATFGPGMESEEPVIVACCANGEDGEQPWHEGGVCVLRSDGRPGFVTFEEMEGYDGGPVKVGPGSPDPRFARLVR